MHAPPEHPSRRPNWPLVVALLAAVALAIGYVFVWPLMVAPSPWLLLGQEELLRTQPTYRELVFDRLAEFSIGVWVFVFGASIGSFLNVVIYRVPRGLTLLGTSQCPKCGHAIRPYDNLPVFGWLALRGRCRDCQLPISPRYPLIEALTAATFLLLAYWEIGSHPAPTLVGGPGIALYAYHCWLLCVLLSWALIQLDRQAVPRAFMALVVVVGFAVPIVYPGVYPVLWDGAAGDWVSAPGRWARWDTSVVGFLAGSEIGWLCVRIEPNGSPGAQRARWAPTMAALAVVGLYLGWQAAVTVGLLATAAALLCLPLGHRWATLRHGFVLLWVFPAAVLQIGLWKLLGH